ncbi:MAG: transglutaminase-like domain-containing protein [Candidatus Woesearchaeota archaeon]
MTACASEDNSDEIYNDLMKSKIANLELNITLRARLIKGKDYYIKNISFKTRTFPKNNSYQRIIFFETLPNSKITDEELTTELMPNEIIDFKLNSIIQREKIYLTAEEIQFPENSSGMEEYLKRTSRFNFNERIKRKASELTEGSPDLFSAVSEIGFWIYKNMEYDLNYSNFEKDAVWVFENMRGTCDEYSTLYVAMLRSIGIPARVVSGIAYSDLEETRGFNPHAWIEAYFNSIGWVPFDANYGEFGFLDNSHIILEYPSENKSQITYSWVGNNIEIVSESSVMNASVLELEKTENDEGLKIEVYVFKKEIYLDSYNVVYSVIENKLRSYRTICLKISENKNVILEDDVEKCVVLKPESKSTIYWFLRTSGFERNYIYKVPVVVYNNVYRAETNFAVSENYPKLSKEGVYEFAKSFEKREYVRKIELKCSPKEFYEDEDNLTCVLRNLGNTILEPLIVCFSKECFETKLSINDNVTLNFKINNSKIGFSREEIALKAEDFSKNYLFEYKVIETPKISITKVEIPEKTSFRDNFRIKISIKKEKGNLDYAVLYVTHENFERKINIENIQEENELIIELPSKLLNEGENKINLRIAYFDKRQRKYFVESKASINLEKLNIWQKILLKLYKLQEKLNIQ